MDFSPPTPASNVTPVWFCLDNDDTCKWKSVCTPTRPTTPQNERATPSNRPPSGPRSFALSQNPYRWSSQPQSDVFIADTSHASTPQVQRSCAISVTPVLVPHLFRIATFIGHSGLWKLCLPCICCGDNYSMRLSAMHFNRCFYTLHI
jgi:hypothetical protein